MKVLWNGALFGILAVGAVVAPSHAEIEAPRKIVAVLDSTQNWGTTRRAINFYDVTAIDSGSASDVFSQTPLFSVWTGFEQAVPDQFSEGVGNFEDPGALTVNPINGTVYQVAFDSGSNRTVGGSVASENGDTDGTYDIYRIDYQEILNYHLSSGNANGTMYAPMTAAYAGNGSDYDDGVETPHPDHLTTTVFVENAIAKVGEVARPSASSPFYDYGVEFYDPSKLVVMDNEVQNSVSTDDAAYDHQIRVFERVSTSAGAANGGASANTDDLNDYYTEGGFNGQGEESWESYNYGTFEMDYAGGVPTGRSEVEDIALVEKDGVIGIWVGESDGGGDDLSFFELDFVSRTATKRELLVGSGPYPTGTSLDENPVANPNTNDGVLDRVFVDADGNLVVVESGYYDTGAGDGVDQDGDLDTGNEEYGQEGYAQEPKIIGRSILNYNYGDSDLSGVGEIEVGSWSVSSNLPAPTGDDDADVTDGRFVTYDKGTGYVYFFDADSGAQPDVVGDVYVFDPATGNFVYEEQNATNHFLEQQGLELFLRGDATGDGLITASDIDMMFAMKNDPTKGGALAAALGKEWYDLTGDADLTQTDVEELVEVILGTTFGDMNLDGATDTADFTIWRNSFLSTSVLQGWANGDVNGDGAIDTADFTIWREAFLAPTGSGFGLDDDLVNADWATFDRLVSVPEPASIALLALGGAAMLLRRRSA